MKYLHIVGVLLPASKHGLQLSFLKVMQHVLAVLIFGIVYLLLERFFCIVVSNGYILGVTINSLQSSCLPFVEEVTDVSLHESQGHHIYVAVLLGICFVFVGRTLDLMQSLHPHALLQNVNNAK